MMVVKENEILLRAQRRTEILRGVRSWFAQAGFLEIDAPILVPGTGCEPFIDPMETTMFWERGEPKENRYLHTSPELYLKRLMFFFFCYCCGPVLTLQSFCLPANHALLNASYFK